MTVMLECILNRGRLIVTNKKKEELFNNLKKKYSKLKKSELVEVLAGLTLEIHLKELASNR